MKSFLECLPGDFGLDWIVGLLWPAFNGIACANRFSSLAARSALKRCFSAALGEDATARLGVSWNELRCAFSWRPQVLVVGGCAKPRGIVRYRLCGDGSGGFPFESELITSIHRDPDYYSFDSEFAVAYCDGFVYATNDANSYAYLHRFNVATGSWDLNFEPEFPGDLLSDNDSFAGSGLVASGSDLYLAGGMFSADSRAVMKFKTRENSFHRVAPLIIGRSLPGMVSLPNALLIAGGVSPEAECSVERYSFVDDLWSRLADMNWARDAPSLFVVSGRVYVLGGIPGDHWDLDEDPNDEILTALEVYDDEQNEWSEVESSQFLVSSRLTAVGLPNNQIASFDGVSESLFTLHCDGHLVQARNRLPCIDGHGFCWSQAALTSAINWIDK